MIGNTIVRVFGVSFGVGALAFASAAYAGAGREPIYDYYYYDDANHTTQVGRWAGACYNTGAGVEQYPEGQVTQYYDQVQTGWCEDGVTTWL